jgi:putative tryptophan/tyrosine transport system substrate-binding protein
MMKLEVRSQKSKVSKSTALSFFSFTLGTLLYALCFPVEAQQPKKVPRIGFLFVSSLSSNSARIEAFREGLHELRYIEGENIAIEWRSAEEKTNRVPTLAAELVRLKVDVMVTAGPAATRPAKEATVSIPIVMAQDSDPVGNGFVASLARPGGNITGLSTLSPELSGKQLELLKEIVRKLSTVAVIGNSNRPGNAQALKEMELAAGRFGVKLQYLDVRDPMEIEPTFKAASNGRVNGVLMLGNPIATSHRTQIADLAVKNRLPVIYDRPEFVEDGGLMTYSVSQNELYRRAATYVDKILKGAKPANLPVEQPTKFELIVNLKAAKSIGLTIPPNVLARADRVIK